MAFTSYPKTNQKYDIDNAVKVTASEAEYDTENYDGDAIMVEAESGEQKIYDLDYIDECLEACATQDDYTNTTRYNFWNALKTKAVSMGVSSLTTRPQQVIDERQTMINSILTPLHNYRRSAYLRSLALMKRNPGATVGDYLLDITNCTLLHEFESTTPSKNTLSSGGTLVLGDAVLEAPPTGTENIFSGILEIKNSTNEAYFSAPNNEMNRKYDHDRSWVMCLQLGEPGTGEKHLFGCSDSASRLVAGVGRNTATSDFLRFQGDGYYDGTGTPASLTSIDPADYVGKLAIIFVSWYAGALETTIGWWVDGMGGFQTNAEEGWGFQADTGVSDNYYFGGNQNKALVCNIGAFAVYDQQITAADLDLVATLMALN